jgi:translation initiation factor IF-2
MVNDSIRINKILKEFNIGMTTLVEFLQKKGIKVEANPNGKVSEDVYTLVTTEFGKEHALKEASKKISWKPVSTAPVSVADIEKKEPDEEPEERSVFIKSNTVDIGIDLPGPKIIGKLSNEQLSGKPQKQKQKVEQQTPIKPVKQQQGKQQPAKQQPGKQQPAKQQSSEPQSKQGKQQSADPQTKQGKQQSVEPQTKSVKQQSVEPAKSVEQVKPVTEQPKKMETQKSEEVITAKQRVGELKAPKVIEKIDIKSIEKPRKTDEKDKPRDKNNYKDKNPEHKDRNPEHKDRNPEHKDRNSEHKKKKSGQSHNPRPAQSQTPQTPQVKANQTVADLTGMEPRVEPEFIKTKVEQLSGPNVVGKIDLNQFKKTSDNKDKNKKKRQRIKKDGKINVSAEVRKDTIANNNNNNN